METFKKLLSETGQFSKEQIMVADETLCNIASGDLYESAIYQTINDLVRRSNELTALKSQLAGIVGVPVATKQVEPTKRKYTKKATPAELPLPSEKKTKSERPEGKLIAIDESESIDL